MSRYRRCRPACRQTRPPHAARRRCGTTRRLEAVQAVEGRPIGDGEAPRRHDAIGGAEPGAVVGGDVPAPRRLVEGRLGNGRAEADVPAEVEPVRHMLQVAQDLGLGGEALAPPPLLLERVGELVGVLDAVEIAAGARVTVPVPGAADPAALLQDAHREPHRAQPMEHVEAGKARADNDRIEVRRSRGAQPFGIRHGRASGPQHPPSPHRCRALP